MGQEVVANTTQALLNMANGLDHTVTAIVVDDASVFPAANQFRVVIDNEIILVQSVASNTLTCLRGQEGTPAMAHLDSSAVVLVVTAGGLYATFAAYQVGHVGGIAVFRDIIVQVGNAAHAPQFESDNVNDYQDVAANGDSRSAVVYLPDGIFTWRRMSWYQPNMGKVDCMFDGALVGTLDLYSAGAGNWQNDVIASGLAVAAGHHRLEFKVNGKNVSSTGYYVLHSVTWFE